MAPKSSEDPEITDLTNRFRKLSLESNIDSMPPELLIQVFEKLDPKSLGNVRLSSRGLLPAADTAMLRDWRARLDLCQNAATAIYDYLLPNGQRLPEYSDVNRPPRQPRTALTIQVAASVMNVIPERQPHLVETVLAIEDTYVKAESMDAMARHQKHFDKANLEPIIDEAFCLSSIHHEGSTLTDPTIPANRVLIRTASSRTRRQQAAISERMRWDRPFERWMRPEPIVDLDDYGRERRTAPALKISEVDQYSIRDLGHNFVGQNHHRMEALIEIAQRISETSEHLTELTRSFSRGPVQLKAAQPASARDFSDRPPRGSIGREG